MLLPLDVVALRLIEDEGVAEVGDVASDGDVVGGNPVGVEDVDDVVGRVEVAGIVHHVLGQSLQHSGVGTYCGLPKPSSAPSRFQNSSFLKF